ncbi:MAG: yut [Firmicutes bacterium]|nr:yut [Bacillota bacterium]
MAARATPGSPISSFLTYLRASVVGVAQVFFINNVWTGLIFLAAIFWNNPVYGVAAAIGTLAATATAYLIGISGEDIKAGLYGFNGTLLAIALPFFIGYGGTGQVTLWVFVVLGAALTTVIEAAFVHLLTPYRIPASTGPFVLTGWLLLASVWAFTGLHMNTATAHLGPAAFPLVPQPGQAITFSTVWNGFFRGIGEVMFMDNVISGALFLLGIFVGGWRGGLMAAMGAAIGVFFPALLGANEQTIRLGLLAFNPTLTAIAVGAVFLPFSGRSVVYAFAAGLVTLVFSAALGALLGVIGLPTLTAPFVFTMYLFIAARNVGKALNPPVP